MKEMPSLMKDVRVFSATATGKGRSQLSLSQSGIHRVTVTYQQWHEDLRDYTTAAK